MSELSDSDTNHGEEKEKLLLDVSPISEDDLKEDNLAIEIEEKHDEIECENASDSIGQKISKNQIAESSSDQDNETNRNEGQNNSSNNNNANNNNNNNNGNDSDGMYSDWSDDGDEILQNIEQIQGNY